MKPFTLFIAFFFCICTSQNTSAQVSNISGNINNNSTTNVPLGDGSIILKNLSTLDSVVLPLTNEFTFENVPNGDNYELYILRTPTDDDLNGVSTLDIVLIQRHILGIEAFVDNNKLLAADVNNDDKITVFDTVILRKLILGITQTLDINYKIRDKNNITEQKIVINNLAQDMTNQDFVIVKVGDINGNHN